MSLGIYKHENFHLYFILKYNTTDASVRVQELASMMGILCLSIPYINQRAIPKTNKLYIRREIALVFLVFQTWITCGIKEVVVSTAAQRPISSMGFIRANDLEN